MEEPYQAVVGKAASYLEEGRNLDTETGRWRPEGGKGGYSWESARRRWHAREGWGRTGGTTGTGGTGTGEGTGGATYVCGAAADTALWLVSEGAGGGVLRFHGHP